MWLSVCTRIDDVRFELFLLREYLSVYLWKVIICFLWINEAYVGKYFGSMSSLFWSSLFSRTSFSLPTPIKWTLVENQWLYSSTQALQYQKTHLYATCGIPLLLSKVQDFLSSLFPPLHQIKNIELCIQSLLTYVLCYYFILVHI